MGKATIINPKKKISYSHVVIINSNIFLENNTCATNP